VPPAKPRKPRKYYPGAKAIDRLQTSEANALATRIKQATNPMFDAAHKL
jgi:hypothetical protein